MVVDGEGNPQGRVVFMATDVSWSTQSAGSPNKQTKLFLKTRHQNSGIPSKGNSQKGDNSPTRPEQLTTMLPEGRLPHRGDLVV